MGKVGFERCADVVCVFIRKLGACILDLETGSS